VSEIIGLCIFAGLLGFFAAVWLFEITRPAKPKQEPYYRIGDAE
jgi:hypothetical protein